MGTEIERKFLLQDHEFLNEIEGEFFRQGYLPSKNLTTIRVRVVGKRGYLTIKGKNSGISRLEYEYDIPLDDANGMLEALCEKPLIEKVRYKIQFEGLCWEVDKFDGENKGLIVAEVELESEDQAYKKPVWVGEEVSGDPKYYNSSLVSNPFKNW